MREGHIVDQQTVDLGLRLSGIGVLDRENAAICEVAVETVRRWRRLYQRRGHRRGTGRGDCPFCDGAELDTRAYAHALGW
jgi:hypothetical protein